jgi:hypothetical protein
MMDDKCSVCGHDAEAHFGKDGEGCDDCFGHCKVDVRTLIKKDWTPKNG